MTKKQEESNADNKMWVEKYRPNLLSDLIAHEQIIGTINKLVDANRLPHLLLYGPPGTGKTSTILAVARKMYGKNLASYVLELNASDERGIDVVRDQIKDFASTQKIFSTGFKLIILDEADHMTKDAQAALRRVMEQYTRNTRFCLICNYVNKIIPAVQSRCTRFRFAPLTKQQAISRISDIAQKENVECDAQGLEAIFRLSGGDMRKCLNILQSTTMSFGKVTEDNVHLTTGHPLRKESQLIVNWLFNLGFEEAFNNVLEMKNNKGLALVDIIHDLHSYILRMAINEKIQMFLMEKISDIEYALSFGTNEKLQLSALIGAFQIAKETHANKLDDVEKYMSVANYEV
ncbi:replication factor C subunit 3/5 [Acrasis kona]|uniref:Replication factor C subunit 3/5 n=1 Tax=Acrasis kona TaxID=1008807 RepID=A0AAW2YTF9_9EUKA